MEQSLTFLRDIGGESRSQVYWSTQSATTAIVFVHGFLPFPNQKPIKTWANFPDMLRRSEGCEAVDLVLFGYDSHRFAETSGMALKDFLYRLYANPSSLGSPRKPCSYHSIIVVAHSLGALVTRLALLDARMSSRSNTDRNMVQPLSWPTIVHAIFFAAADRGAYLGDIIAELLNIACPLKIKVPVLDDLLSTSDTVKRVFSDTNAALSAGDSKYMVATTLWGGKDNVVRPHTFACKAERVYLAGQTHSSVCKPSELFTSPVEHVLKCLKVVL